MAPASRNPLETDEHLLELFQEDAWITRLVAAIRRVEIPDAWLVAGVLRAKVWDTLHGYVDRTPAPDVDVAYFDLADTNEATEKAYDKQLRRLVPDVKWSCKNQARMAQVHGRTYRSAFDGVADYPETATAIGVRLTSDGELELLAPHGIADLVGLHLAPNPVEASSGAATFRRRVAEKNWQAQWPKLQLLEESQWQ